MPPSDAVTVLPLFATTLRAGARGGLARVVLEQRFGNPHARPLSVTYAFPLPADAAVSGFSFTVAGRKVIGTVANRAEARERFEEAICEGRLGAVLEQNRSSMFRQELGNVPPGEEVVVELVLDQRLAWLDEGAWEWRFPTALAPRYLGGPGRVSDAELVRVSSMPPGELGGTGRSSSPYTPSPTEAIAAGVAEFSLELDVRDELGARPPESPSHALSVSRAGGGLRVALAAGSAPLDRDAVVRWSVVRPQAKSGADAAVSLLVGARAPSPRDDRGGLYALLTLVPPAGARSAPVPRDVCVLLDISGSMAGRPVDQARRVVAALIDGLGDADALELYAFSTAPLPWRPEPVAATAAAKRDAIEWLASLQAGGGTEMRTAVVEALRGLRPEAQRQVVLVSDGLIGFESQVVAEVLAQLPTSSRLHTVAVGSAPNRSLTAAAARAGRGVEIVIGLDEDAERAAQRLLARTEAPVVVDLEVTGGALLALAPSRPPDVFAGAPVLLAAEVRPGELWVRGRTAAGPWEQRLQVVAPDASTARGDEPLAALFAREAVEDLELALAAGREPAETQAAIEALGLRFSIATRRTSWVATSSEVVVDPAAPRAHARVAQVTPYGMSVEGFGLRPAVASGRRRLVATERQRRSAPGIDERADARFDSRDSLPGPGDFEEKTRVTKVLPPAPPELDAPPSNDCIVVIYSKTPTLLGKRFTLEHSPMRVGRGGDNDLVLDEDSVSRRHAHLERRNTTWHVVDDRSTNGTFCNDEQIRPEQVLHNGDRVKIGPTIFKFLSGADVEAQYHEEIYRMTIIDGLTQVHNRRYLIEALEREIIRARRHERALSFLIFDVDFFKNVNDQHGHLAGDFVLKELARVVQSRIRRDEVFARYGGEEFAVVLPETPLEGALALAETLRQKVEAHDFTFQADHIRVTMSIGAALLADTDRNASDLIARADQLLYEAKEGGRNRVCGQK
jgi:Ca-activated chloride channel family protein